MYESANFPFEIRYPADWDEVPDDQGELDAFGITKAFVGSRGELLLITEEDLFEAGVGELTLDEYLELVLFSLSSEDQSLEVISTVSAFNSQGLPTLVLEMSSGPAGVIRTSRFIYVHENKIGFNATYTAPRLFHKELEPLMEYTFSTFAIQDGGSIGTTATPRPATTSGSNVMQAGTLSIAVLDVNYPSGIPRFCTAGCAETIYLSGITETLFNSIGLSNGTITTEDMLAQGFTLDPSLEFADFTLRQGVRFHGGWGEMTSADVAFSYNDANSITNPESIHGQAGDFAPLIQSLESRDKYTVRLNYRNYDSRGILHRFSQFWQTAGIVSANVYGTLGTQGMEDTIIGVGPFQVDEWTQDKGIFLTAFDDYYGTPLGLGPFVRRVRWLEVPESASREAMLQVGEVEIAQVSTKGALRLVDEGFNEQTGARFSTIRDISFAGNYWDKHSALAGGLLERDRDISKPWVGDPFQNGTQYDSDTVSMRKSRLVRNAFAWAIDRDAIVISQLGRPGVVNFQPYLSINDPNYRSEWSWGTDFGHAKELMEEAGYGDGFEMDLWVGTSVTGAEIGEALSAGWLRHLNVSPNLVKVSYSTYRPGLVARTNTTPGINICGDENKSNFSYDWAHGFVVSSLSSGGYGVGQELPYATLSFLNMAGEPDKSKRKKLAADFYEQNRFWANCVGLYEEPIRPIYSPSIIAEWDQRPTANGNLGTINNIRSVKLK